MKLIHLFTKAGIFKDAFALNLIEKIENVTVDNYILAETSGGAKAITQGGTFGWREVQRVLNHEGSLKDLLGLRVVPASDGDHSDAIEENLWDLHDADFNKHLQRASVPSRWRRPFWVLAGRWKRKTSGQSVTLNTAYKATIPREFFIFRNNAGAIINPKAAAFTTFPEVTINIRFPSAIGVTDSTASQIEVDLSSLGMGDEKGSFDKDINFEHFSVSGRDVGKEMNFQVGNRTETLIFVRGSFTAGYQTDFYKYYYSLKSMGLLAPGRAFDNKDVVFQTSVPKAQDTGLDQADITAAQFSYAVAQGTAPDAKRSKSIKFHISGRGNNDTVDAKIPFEVYQQEISKELVTEAQLRYEGKSHLISLNEINT